LLTAGNAEAERAVAVIRDFIQHKDRTKSFNALEVIASASVPLVAPFGLSFVELAMSKSPKVQSREEQ
jgi:hypothetical protein